MKLDEINDIDDFSQITLGALSSRLEQSTTVEQLIYRETELDEVWRLVDIALTFAERERDPQSAALARLKAAVMQAHDLVGIEERPIDAAAILRNI